MSRQKVKARTLRNEIRRIVGERPGIVRHALEAVLLGDEELADELGLTPEKIARALHQMTHEQQIRRDDEGHYHLVPAGERTGRRAPPPRPETADEGTLPGGESRKCGDRPGPAPTQGPDTAVPKKLLALAAASEAALHDYIESRGDPVLNALLESAARARDALAAYRERVG